MALHHEPDADRWLDDGERNHPSGDDVIWATYQQAVREGWDETFLLDRDVESLPAALQLVRARILARRKTGTEG